MTEVDSRPPSFLQPNPKAAPSSSTSAVAATASTISQTSRASSSTREPAIEQPIYPPDIPDEATATLIRQVLCPETRNAQDGETALPTSKILPSLTSSNEVDVQLYAIIAVIIREFVTSWYARFTQNHDFIEELVLLIAHCTRALEERLRHVDLEELFFDEIPELIERHVFAYRTSHEQVSPPPLQRRPHEVYHTLCPHPALSPIPDPTVSSTVIEQQQNEAAYFRLMAQGVLAVLLPPEELESACFRTLVTDFFGEVILGRGIGRVACEGWFIWKGITKIAETLRRRLAPKITGEEIVNDTRSRLEKVGLLSTNEESDADKAAQVSVLPLWFSTIIWRILQFGYLAFIAMRFITLGLYTATSRPSRSSTSANPFNGSTNPSPTVKPGEAPTLESPRGSKRPIVTMRIWSLAWNLADLADRMPWLTGSLSFLQYQLLAGVGRVGATDGLLDRFLSQTLTTHFLDPGTVLPPLLALRTTVFPNDTWLGREPPPPSPTSTQNPQSTSSSITDPGSRSSSSSSSSMSWFIHETFPSSSSLLDIPIPTPAPTAPPPRSQQLTISNPPAPASTPPLSLDQLGPSPPPSSSSSPPPSPRPTNPPLIPALSSSPSPSPSSNPPDPAPQPSPISPLPLHDLLKIKHRASTAIHSLLNLLLPHSFLQPFFNPPTAGTRSTTPTQQIEDRFLDLFADTYLNKHLLYSVLECVVVRVVPEMGVAMSMSEGGGARAGERREEVESQGGVSGVG